MQDGLGSRAEVLQKEIRAFNEKHSSRLLGPPGPSTSSAVTPASPGRPSPGPNPSTSSPAPRTTSRPVFVAPCEPMNVHRRVGPSLMMDLDEFKDKHKCPD